MSANSVVYTDGRVGAHRPVWTDTDGLARLPVTPLPLRPHEIADYRMRVSALFTPPREQDVPEWKRVNEQREQQLSLKKQALKALRLGLA